MTSLSETQAAFRTAITGGPSAGLIPLLQSTGDGAERLAIYRRHHRESFRRHLRGRFPTLEWLLGTAQLVAIADLTLTLRPPQAPSLAEYGEELVDTLLDQGLGVPPYAVDVARLDWSLGCLSVSIAAAPLQLGSLAAVDPRRLPQLSIRLQPGLAFLRSGWPVDELLHVRQQTAPPERLSFEPSETRLQLRGARGRFSLQRLDPGAFAFRKNLATGGTLAAAADAGQGAQPSFQLSHALATLFAEDLVIAYSGEPPHA